VSFLRPKLYLAESSPATIWQAQDVSSDVTGIVFDMDGTLIDSTQCVTGAYRQAILEGGGRDYSPTEIVAAYPLGPPGVILAHLLGREANEEDEACYLAALAERVDAVVIYPGIADLLHTLVGSEVPLAVFTGASRAAAGVVLSAVGMIDFFPVIVGGDQVLRPKPEPDGVVQSCELLGLPPWRVAYVGDSSLDLEAATRAGAVAVAAGWGHLFDPSAPCDAVVRRPADVLDILSTAAVGVARSD
jgi:phosphoglycolate phosphatase-like HAD superfamily hydrolase